MGERKLKVRSSAYENRMIVIRTRKSGSPFSTSININIGGHLWSLYSRGSLGGRLVTQNFDRATIVPFELDESTKINVTKRCIQLLNFGGRIFAQNVEEWPKTGCWRTFDWVYYESKREPKIRGMNKCRCDERLQTKTKEFTRLPYTGLVLELEHLKIETRLN